jgi:hypothetical protein
MSDHLHDWAFGIFNTPKATSIPIAVSGDGQTTLTAVMLVSGNSQEDMKEILGG